MARSTNSKSVRPAARRNSAVERSAEQRSDAKAPNPVWFKPLMFGFMILGLAWIIVFYVSGSSLPVPQLANWNILVGFGIMFIGFIMTTQWR